VVVIFPHGLVDVEYLSVHLHDVNLSSLLLVQLLFPPILRKVLEPGDISFRYFSTMPDMYVSSVAMAMDTATIATVTDSLFITRNYE
jgi:hypothetical protein